MCCRHSSDVYCGVLIHEFGWKLSKHVKSVLARWAQIRAWISAQFCPVKSDLDSRLHVENAARILLTVDLPRMEVSRYCIGLSHEGVWCSYLRP